jgi:hypothetical protein
LGEGLWEREGGRVMVGVGEMPITAQEEIEVGCLSSPMMAPMPNIARKATTRADSGTISSVSFRLTR